MSSRQRSAAHEAGHLAFALVHGWHVSGANVDGGLHGRGSVEAVPVRNHIELQDAALSGGCPATVTSEYENIILQVAAGPAGEEILFGFSEGEGGRWIEGSDWWFAGTLIDDWNEDPSRPALQFSAATPFGDAKAAARTWLITGPHLELFHRLRALLETKSALTADECADLQRDVLKTPHR